jgi:hypothetical protein
MSLSTEAQARSRWTSGHQGAPSGRQSAARPAERERDEEGEKARDKKRWVRECGWSAVAKAVREEEESRAEQPERSRSRREELCDKERQRASRAIWSSEEGKMWSWRSAVLVRSSEPHAWGSAGSTAVEEQPTRSQ